MKAERTIRKKIKDLKTKEYCGEENEVLESLQRRGTAYIEILEWVLEK